MSDRGEHRKEWMGHMAIVVLFEVVVASIDDLQPDFVLLKVQSKNTTRLQFQKFIPLNLQCSVFVVVSQEKSCFLH
ncbi:hypothetical protein D3C80_1766590 [compost metagenome]